MNTKCPIAITCPGPQPGLEGDSPVSNYTAELPDTLDFEGFTYPIFDNNNTIGGTDTTGPFPPWLAAGCQSLCISFLSSDDAFACAARQAFICAHTPPTGPQPNFFFNTQQNCPFTCPDGTLYVFTVLPGYFVALSQAEADGLAQALACERAIVDHVCMGNLTSQGCVNSPYSSTIQLSGNFPMGVSVVSGSLPPGFVLSQDPAGMTATVSGTCNTPGNYQFALMATDPLGNFHVKNFTITILGITNISSLAHPMVNRPYSAQLNGAGGTTPFTFTAPNGGLPHGLALSTSGLISGTPDIHYSGAFQVDFKISDANNNSCTQTWKSKVDEPPGPNWTQLIWDTYTISQNPTNPVSGSGSGPNANGSLQKDNGAFFPTISPVHAGGLAYTGVAVNCGLTRVISASSGFVAMAIRVKNNGVPLILTPNPGNPVFPAPGTYLFTFIMPISMNALIEVDDASPGNQFAQLNGVGTPGNLAFTYQLYNL